jgi:ZIP family zinc transporter
MDTLIQFVENSNPIWVATLAGIFTWLVTALGSSIVFFFKKVHRAALDGMLGFTGGVMVSISFWGLLLPAWKMSDGSGFEKTLPIAIGFVLGALFIFFLDRLLPHLHINFREEEKEGIKTPWRRSTLLMLAITLHNIPEGLAIGVMFGGIGTGATEATIAGAIILTLGIAVQNFPEGVAISMPMRRNGASRWRSFNLGQLSASVEPLFAFIGALAVTFFTPLLPYALGFAAGAMIFVVVEEVIPETQRDKYTDIATLSFIFGFVLMMVLDLTLGGGN